MSLKYHVRNCLWRLLGVDYRHILKVVDYVYMKEDCYTKIGYKSYSNNALVFRWGNAPVDIGKYCSIADNVRFIVEDGKHKFNIITCYPFKSNKMSPKAGIRVGNDVWIGQSAIIMNGITIGDGAIVAAGAVVTDDVEPYTIVGGVPAKILKRRCSADEAKEMQKIAWWNWPDNTIDARLSDFRLSFTEFIAKYK